MATRNFYVKVAQRFVGRIGMLRMVFLFVAIGGFAVLLGNALLMKSMPMFEIGGRLWFTSTVVVGVAYEASSYFNPERDPKDVALSESGFVFVLNCQILIGLFPWFLS